MTLVKVPAGRSVMTETASGLEVIIPARRNYFLLAFLSFWLVGWGFGWVMAARQLVLESAPAVFKSFLAAWLVFWTFGGFMAMFILVWSFRGRERIVFGRSTLMITREIFGIGRRREYANSAIRNLRVSPAIYNPLDFRSGLQLWGFGGGVVAFDYGADTVHFAAVQEGEGESIVKRLLATRYLS